MESIRIESAGGVEIVRMTHGKANAIDLELCEALISSLDVLADSAARAVVLTGTGTIFSAGVDLLRFERGGRDYLEVFVPAVTRLVRALFTFPKPLVAAVNGHAVAGGCIIACTADHRIMARGTGRIGVPELHVGVPFPTAALEAVRFIVPPQHLQAVVYGGATYPAEAALGVGLVDEVVADDALLDHAVAAAVRLAAHPSDVFALTKRQLRAPALARFDDGAARDVEVQSMWESASALERVRRYVQRTFKPAAS